MIKDIILHNLAIYRRDNLVALYRCTIALAMFPLVQYAQYLISGRPLDDWAFTNPAIIVIIYSIMVGATSIYKPFEEKSTSILHSMLPANNVEKFFTGILYHTIGGILVFALAILCADALQALFGFLVSGKAFSLTLMTFEKIKDIMFINPNTPHKTAIVGKIYLVLFTHATYTLAGSYFRHNALLKSFIAINVINLFILLFIVLPIGGFNLSNGMIVICRWIAKHDILSYIIFYGFIAFCYWKSYRRFCRKAIV